MPGHASTKRKAIFFDIKRKIIAQKEKEEGNTAIGRDLGLSESNVRIICVLGGKLPPSFVQYVIDSEAQDLCGSVVEAVEVIKF